MDTTYSITSSSVSDRGLSELRPQNEDSFAELPEHGLYVVADGVGGAAAGEVASQMAVEMLSEAFANRSGGQDPEAVMRIAISQANSAIFQMSQELPQLSNMATTVVAVHVDGDSATVAHVGDSRLYRVDREGDLHADTDDHSVVADEVRAGRMTPEQAENHPGRNVISRALGAEPTVEIDLKTIYIEPGTALLLCTDGITRHVTDAEIKGVLTFGGEPADVCEYLKKLCLERGAEDNFTAVVVKVAQSGAHPPLRTTFDEGEEPTVAAARPPIAVSDPDDDDELLELDTLEMERRAETLEFEATDPDIGDAEPEPRPEIAAAEPIEIDEPTHEEPRPAAVSETVDGSEFSMFGSSATDTDEPGQSSTASRYLAALGILVLGSLIGLGIYHFVLAPKPTAAPPVGDALSVMKTEDIAFSSFEKLRRTVDADPAAYVKEVPSAQGAEDHYLIGRAYLLLGDFPRARLAFVAAQKELPRSEPANAKVLQADVATALMIVNDPALQVRFKQELEAAGRLAAGANANTNANTTASPAR